MNKKILMGSLFSLMIILIVMMSANFVVALAGMSATGALAANGAAGTTTSWINISSNQSNVKIDLLPLNLATNNITKVTVVIPRNLNLTTNTNGSVSSNFTSGSGNESKGVYSNDSNLLGYFGEGGSLITFINVENNWNSSRRFFSFNVTAAWQAADYNVTWNVTLWNSSASTYEILLYLGVDTNATMVFSGINITDGVNTLYSDQGEATNSRYNLNGSGYLRNTNTNNLTVNAMVTNADTSVHYVTMFYNITGAPKTAAANSTYGQAIMTRVDAGLYQANLSATGWNNVRIAWLEYGPIDRTNASYVNFSFFILVNDTLNIGYTNYANNSQNYYNFTFDGTNPNAPDITMPSTTIIYAGNKITIKCRTNGDNPVASGVLKTTLKITKPDGTTVSKEVPIESQEVEFTGSDIITPGDYSVACTSEDYVGWTRDDSTTDTFKVVYYSTGAGGGGAGGEAGGAAAEVKVFDVDFSKLNEKEFSRNEGTKVTFSLDGTTEHKITWTKVEANSVTLTIESTPQEVQLNVGESKDVDVTGDGINDISVKLVKIDDNKADVITTKLAGAAETPSGGETPSGETTPSGTVGTSSSTWIIIAIVVIIIIIIGYFFMRKK